jgi:hypothetical protein
MAKSPLWQSILSYWRRQNIFIRPGVTLEDIAAFEHKYSVTLPADLTEYFRLVDGTGMDEFDEHLTSFLSLAEMRPVHDWLNDSGGVVYPDRFAYPDCFVFADHFLSSWLYAVQITSDPTNPCPVYRVTASAVPGKMEARSFREFMTKYANDPLSIL